MNTKRLPEKTPSGGQAVHADALATSRNSNAQQQPPLSVTNLRLDAAGRVLLQNLGFSAQAGERWCVIGRNAAGKSTLLRALAGLHAPSAGQVAAAKPAYLPQATSDRFELSVREYVQLHVQGLRHAQLPTQTMPIQAAGQRADVDVGAGAGAAKSMPSADPLAAHCQALDIAHLMDRPITQLSGGERQRVGLAAVAAQNAALWLLDEPVSFQDPAHQGVVGRWLLAQSSAPNPKAIVMTAHDMAWVQSYATHLIAIYDDMTLTLGKISDILDEKLLHDTFACQWRQVGSVWVVV